MEEWEECQPLVIAGLKTQCKNPPDAIILGLHSFIANEPPYGLHTAHSYLLSTNKGDRQYTPPPILRVNTETPFARQLKRDCEIPEGTNYGNMLYKAIIPGAMYKDNLAYNVDLPARLFDCEIELLCIATTPGNMPDGPAYSPFLLLICEEKRPVDPFTSLQVIRARVTFNGSKAFAEYLWRRLSGIQISVRVENVPSDQRIIEGQRALQVLRLLGLQGPAPQLRNKLLAFLSEADTAMKLLVTQARQPRQRPGLPIERLAAKIGCGKQTIYDFMGDYPGLEREINDRFKVLRDGEVGSDNWPLTVLNRLEPS